SLAIGAESQGRDRLLVALKLAKLFAAGQVPDVDALLVRGDERLAVRAQIEGVGRYDRARQPANFVGLFQVPGDERALPRLRGQERLAVARKSRALKTEYPKSRLVDLLRFRPRKDADLLPVRGFPNPEDAALLAGNESLAVRRNR